MNKVVIITGAAKGIGREIAKKLALGGEKVIVNYKKSQQQAEELQKELASENIGIDIFQADLSKREEVKKLIKYTIEKYGRIDVLINNAGIADAKMFTDVTDEDWDKIIKNNLYSTFCITQEVIPNMVHNKNGCIINISSIWGIVGASCESIYSITKAGIDAMTKSLAKELGPSNIRVNSVAPGVIKTDMIANLKEKDIENIKQETPLEKIGKPEDVAKCVGWLIEDEFTTGQIISINGGFVIV